MPSAPRTWGTPSLAATKRCTIWPSTSCSPSRRGHPSTWRIRRRLGSGNAGCAPWSPSRGSGKIDPRRCIPQRDPTRGGEAVTFKEILAQVIDWLQQDKRLSYRALKRQFALDDDYLDDLKAELIEARRVALDEDGRVLV